jgi:hypothetical protein
MIIAFFRSTACVISLATLTVVAAAGLGWVRYRAPWIVSSSDSPGRGDDRSSEEAAIPELAESERERLWQIEHHGNVLSKTPNGFPSLGRALRQADGVALTQLLAKDFKGQTLNEPKEIRLDRAFANVVRKEKGNKPSRSLDGQQFVQELQNYRRLFHKPPNVHTALMTLSPLDPDNFDSLWEGSCVLRIYGEKQVGMPAEVVLTLKFQVNRPTEEALALGGWLRECSVSQTLQGEVSQPGFLFREAAAERGVDPSRFHDNWTHSEKITNTGGVYLCDYDRDGIVDMLITDVQTYTLYKGLPDGKFRDVTEQVGLPRNRLVSSPLGMLAAFVDLDGDGWEDLILGGRIYKNEEGKRFANVTGRTNLFLPPDASGLAIADYDRDGRVDIYITRPGIAKADSWLDGKSGDNQGNQLWRNKGNWQFENVTAASGADGGSRSTFSAIWLDADNDGWPDLYVINEFGNGVLLLNNGDGTFRQHSLVEGPGDFGSMGVTCGDIDNDGNIDLYIANMYSKAGSRVIGNLKNEAYAQPVMDKMRRFVTGSQLYRNRGGLKFDRLGQEYQVASVGWAYGAALVDLDNDGWLDLVATAGFMSLSRTEPDG